LLKQTVYDFDLKQHKTTFDDWNKAFENSILKRTNEIKHKIFIGLSGGYDSGLISCVLNKLNIDYTAYSILGSEDLNLIKNRHKLLTDGHILDLTQKDFLSQHEFLKEYSEEYLLNIDTGEKSQLNKLKKISLQKVSSDNGAIGMSYVCSLAKPKNQLIYLSGSGADEIISDYGFNKVKHYTHSTIGGYFPNNLESVFPWKNFFGNTQRAYLMKEEIVSGTWGIEGRYPFLDKQVVQEFLWLSNNIKNSNYKSVIHNYLIKNNYPFVIKEKIGFNCGFTGVNDGFNKKDSDNLNTDKTPVGIPKNNRVDLIVKL
jgi:asparagine synthetase B (glutamine-hydrolysing)